MNDEGAAIERMDPLDSLVESAIFVRENSSSLQEAQESFAAVVNELATRHVFLIAQDSRLKKRFWALAEMLASEVRSEILKR